MSDLYHDNFKRSKQEMLKMRWLQHESEGRQFFRNFHINSDGGFQYVSELFLPLRIVFAAVFLLLVTANVSFILFQNLPMLFQPWCKHHIGSSGRLYVTNILLIPLLHAIGLSPGEFLEATVAVAFLEVGLLVLLLAQATKHAFRAMMEGSGVIVWRSMCLIAWKIMPTLSVLSALQVLYWVHPHVLTRDLSRTMRQAKANGRYFKVIKLCVVSVCAAVFGFDVFMAKFHRMIDIVHNQQSPNLMIMIEMLVFRNQVLGVVQFESSMRLRLHHFMFAGSDAILTVGEEIESQVWQAMLAYHIWLEAQKTSAPVAWFLVVMCSHTENDLQMLMLGNKKGKDGDPTESQTIKTSGEARGMVELQELRYDDSSGEEAEAY
eukprot:TRINITY_DN63138_c0_g1_i1.p1 TRINITY_DN63138_c0_g1~~TRINITY_DN63138_c0_g1_i1.p1  ORF type:complete len:377 (+),score=67.78 TRINITY_DN63138_c0_g1_i1:296-1426(+)